MSFFLERVARVVPPLLSGVICVDDMLLCSRAASFVSWLWTVSSLTCGGKCGVLREARRLAIRAFDLLACCAGAPSSGAVFCFMTRGCNMPRVVCQWQDSVRFCRNVPAHRERSRERLVASQRCFVCHLRCQARGVVCGGLLKVVAGFCFRSLPCFAG